VDSHLAGNAGWNFRLLNAGQLFSTNLAQVRLKLREVIRAEFRTGGVRFGHVKQDQAGRGLLGQTQRPTQGYARVI
jgi:hypothetical protein